MKLIWPSCALSVLSVLAACAAAGEWRAVTPTASIRKSELCCGNAVPPPASDPERRTLRISADPNNLPFTNDKLEGFENRIAALIAKDLDVKLEYNWRAQRRGFFRHAFKEREADLVLGVPAGFDLALTTTPYYRSTYVFVQRRDGGPALTSLDDPALRKLRIAVQMIGNDGVNTPPAHALADRGIVDNILGFTVYGDYRQENPPARIIDAVANGEADVAVAWGPMAAFFASRQTTKPLTITPLVPGIDRSGLPFTFAIAMGVRKGNRDLRDKVNAILARRKVEIDGILDEYHVPRVARPQAKPGEKK
jgi:mxaJ protein